MNQSPPMILSDKMVLCRVQSIPSQKNRVVETIGTQDCNDIFFTSIGKLLTMTEAVVVIISFSYKLLVL